MRIDEKNLGFTITGPFSQKEQSSGKGLDFLDTLKEAVSSTNSMVQESEKMGMDLSSGRSANIHEAMIAMQKADITLRLLVNMTNKLIEGYNNLNNLR
jgi:flagellar hook-basal body complex protein FliE